MKSVTARSIAVAGLYVAAASAQTRCSNILIPPYSPPVVARGWQAQLVADGLTKPRSIAFDKTGALLLVESGKGISRHVFTDQGGTCLAPDNAHMVITMPELNHGIALSEDGDILFASSAEAVLAWAYDADSGRVQGEPRTLVANMSNNDLVTRTLLMSQKQPGTLIVSRGSAEDNAAQAANVDSGLSQIRAFNLTNLTDTYYSFPDDGMVLGWGLRNSVGVAEHPVTGGIYAVENSADGVRRGTVDVHENNPGEELNFFGYLNGTDTENQGRSFGYPFCFAVWQADEIPDGAGLSVGKQFAVHEEEDGDDADATFQDDECAEKYVPPRLTFPAHYAPIDIKFSGDGATAYVAFRGSFDPSSPVGYRLSSIAFDSTTGEPVASSDSSDALTDILINRNNSVCPDSCFRPTGLAFDSKGRLWMTSDSTGELYVLERTGEGNGTFVQPEGSDDSAAVGLWTEKKLGVVWTVAALLGLWLAMC
ncbi:hypothetical protein VTI28DRAFT_5441 [Corynascus sepedonium]